MSLFEEEILSWLDDEPSIEDIQFNLFLNSFDLVKESLFKIYIHNIELITTEVLDKVCDRSELFEILWELSNFSEIAGECLHIAIFKLNYSIINRILGNYPDAINHINNYGDTVLHTVSRNPDIDLFIKLADLCPDNVTVYNSNCNNSLELMAYEYDNLDSNKFNCLLKYCFERFTFESKTFISILNENMTDEIVTTIFEHVKDDFEIINKLLATAIKLKRFEWTELLLKKYGANPNFKINEYGMTFVHYVCEYEMFDFLKLLEKYDGILNAPGIIDVCIKNQGCEIIKYLDDNYGIDVNIHISYYKTLNDFNYLVYMDDAEDDIYVDEDDIYVDEYDYFNDCSEDNKISLIDMLIENNIYSDLFYYIINHPSFNIHEIDEYGNTFLHKLREHHYPIFDTDSKVIDIIIHLIKLGVNYAHKNEDGLYFFQNYNQEIVFNKDVLDRFHSEGIYLKLLV